MTSSSPDGSRLTPESTPSLSEILDYFRGTFQMMAGRSEGLRRLDLSADGFWTSFFAILVALPPMALSWVEFEGVQREAPVADTGAALIYTAHALADVLAWIVPVILLMALAKWIGLQRKIVPLVVATNWGNAFLAWIMMPVELLVLATGGELLVLATGGAQAATTIAVIASLAALAFMVRLISVSLGNDLKAAVAITLLMMIASVFSYGLMSDLTGLSLI